MYYLWGFDTDSHTDEKGLNQDRKLVDIKQVNKHFSDEAKQLARQWRYVKSIPIVNELLRNFEDINIEPTLVSEFSFSTQCELY